MSVPEADMKITAAGREEAPEIHWMPTLDLRFERRTQAATGDAIGTRTRFVLQQRWNDIFSDKSEWRDVETVEEAPAAGDQPGEAHDRERQP